MRPDPFWAELTLVTSARNQRLAVRHYARSKALRRSQFARAQRAVRTYPSSMRSLANSLPAAFSNFSSRSGTVSLLFSSPRTS